MIFTIDKQPFGWVVVEGQLSGASQEFAGSGAIIFVRGNIGKDYLIVANLAINEVQARGGSAGRIYRSHARPENKKPDTIDPKQRKLFG